MQQTIPARKQQASRHMSKGRYDVALSLLRKVVKLVPNDAEAQYLLGCSRASLGQWNDAVVAFENSIRIKSDVAQSHYALAGALIAVRREAEAISSLQSALNLNERMTEAHVALAGVLITRGDIEGARSHLDRALEINPRMSDAHLGLGGLEQESGKHRRAIPHLERALKYNPRNVRAMCGMAAALANLSQKKEAEVFYRRALDVECNNVQASCGMALLHNFHGEYEKATNLIDPLLRKKVNSSTLGLAFVQSCKYSGRCEEAIDYINEILKNDRLSRVERKSLNFAVGRVLDRMGQYDAAFGHFKAGNEAMGELYDSVFHAHYIGELVRFFTSSLLMAAPRAGNDDARPVFIVGMPRSGTSLTEQILAVHPEAFAAGELDTLYKITQGMKVALGGKQGFPHYIGALSQGDVDGMAVKYLDKLDGLSGQVRRVIDKMPHNFYLLGVIQLLFPGARVIHCMRNPMDTCLSVYFQDFNEVHKYAKDLFNIGTHYHQYRHLMDHWKKVLTLPILDVQYEELVNDQEVAPRRILEFCELEWNDECLQFHNLKRTVDTASFDQVRQPLYTKSVERWKHYEPFLEELKLGLQREF